MSDFILGHEPAIRLGAFLGILVVMAGWEALAPRRPRSLSRWLRWPSNLGIVVLNTVVLRLAIPVTAVGVAALGQEPCHHSLVRIFPRRLVA